MNKTSLFFCLQLYNKFITPICKVRTFKCYSYQKDTIRKEITYHMKKELPAYPVETTLMLISNRWNVLILRDLMDGTKRFGELKKSLGKISHKKY